MSAPLDVARLEEILTEIGARLLAGERVHGAGGAFSVDVDLGTAARAVVEAGACRIGVRSPGGCPDQHKVGGEMVPHPPVNN